MKTPGWQERLADWAEARIGAPFEWGETDCALLAFEAFDEITGGSLAHAYRARYGDARAALRFQRRFHLDLRCVLVASGCRQMEIQFAKSGDIVCVEKNGFQCGHAIVGGRAVSAWPEKGVYWAELRRLRIDGAVVLRIPG